jgi:hypothetical protein
MNYFEASDPDLTDLVKKEDDEEALGLLISRHSGIYADMVKRYGSKSLSINEIYDIMNEKDYVIYKAALEYDENKAKFSTHVGNKAKYLCLSKKTASKRNNRTLPFDSIEYSEESTLAIIKLINNHQDKRVKVIFQERYFGGEKGKLKTWKNISEQIGLSAQGCINIHDRTLKEFQKQIKNNA